MKVLYALQGTGNGHISRARSIIPLINKHCKTDILLSGYQADVSLPFKVDYKFRGLSFIFGQDGGIDFYKTLLESRLLNLKNEIKSLPVENYDFVINDFEPISAWSCRIKGVPCISLSHQAAVLDKGAPQPRKNDAMGKFILSNYAPTDTQYGFHFHQYSPNLFTPVIRDEIRKTKTNNKGHYTVYLPSYSDKNIIKILSLIKGVNWQVFSKHANTTSVHDHITITPINNQGFIDSLTNCEGLLCGAGFEAPAEAIYLGKKLMVIPMKSQYEQHCNATALKSMGIPVINKLNSSNLVEIQHWVDTHNRIRIEYPDITEKIVKRIFENYIIDQHMSYVSSLIYA